MPSVTKDKEKVKLGTWLFVVHCDHPKTVFVPHCDHPTTVRVYLLKQIQEIDFMVGTVI